MGYVFLNRPAGESYAEFFSRELFEPNWELVAHATLSRVFYAAAREKKTGHVEAFVILTTSDKPGGFNFGYKPIHEAEGPRHNRAPAKVLDALSPLEVAYADSIDAEAGPYAWAKAWRESCRKHLDRPKITAGTTIELPNELHFSDGIKAKRVTYTGKGNRFTVAGQEGHYSIPGWRYLDFALIEES